MLQAINYNKAFHTKLFQKMPSNTSNQVFTVRHEQLFLIFADAPENMTADMHQLPEGLLMKCSSFYHWIQHDLSSVSMDANAAECQNK